MCEGIKYEYAVISVRDPDKLEEEIGRMASSGFRLVAYQTAVVHRTTNQATLPRIDHYAIMERGAVEESDAHSVPEMIERVRQTETSRYPGQER